MVRVVPSRLMYRSGAKSTKPTPGSRGRQEEAMDVLHNLIVKADFWTDAKLLRRPQAKKWRGRG